MLFSLYSFSETHFIWELLKFLWEYFNRCFYCIFFIIVFSTCARMKRYREKEGTSELQSWFSSHYNVHMLHCMNDRIVYTFSHMWMLCECVCYRETWTFFSVPSEWWWYFRICSECSPSGFIDDVVSRRNANCLRCVFTLWPPFFYPSQSISLSRSFSEKI